MQKNDKRIWSIIGILALMGVTVTAVAIFVLYRTAYEEEAVQLRERVQVQVFFLEEMEKAGMSGDEILYRFSSAQSRSALSSRHSEFTLGTMVEDSVVFIMNRELVYPAQREPIPLDENRGIPMQKALQGFSGTTTGPDYRGVEVLAACGYIPSINWGIVAKMDLAAIRKPYIRAGGIATVSALVLILLGGLVVLRITKPIVAGLEQQKHHLNERVKEIQCMYAVTSIAGRDDLPLPEMMDQVVTAIPPGWQYPESTAAQIEYAGNRYTTSNYTGTGVNLRSALVIDGEPNGRVTVERTVNTDKGNAFIPEEQELVNGIAATLQRALISRQSLEALRNSEAKYRNLFDNMPIGLYQTSPDGRFLDANEALAQILGFDSCDELLATDVPQVYANPEDRKEWQEMLANDEVVERHEVEVRRKDGTQGWVQHSTRVVKGEDGDIAYYEGAVEDITERRLAEEKLRESELKFRAMIQNSSDLITIIDSEGVIRYDSPSVRRVLGYSPEKRVGKSAFEYIHQEETEKIAGAIQEVSKESGKTLSIEIRVRHANGSYRILEVTGANMLDTPGVEGIVANARDVTERVEDARQLEEYSRELERSNRELEQFAYVASHDLQEPLRMVTSYLQLLQRRYEGVLDSDADEFIEFAVDGANRMKTLIVDLLKYSRVSTRGKPFELADLNVVVHDVLGYMSFAIEEKSATVRVGDLPELPVDKTQIEQVIQNLIGNSLKYSGDEPPEIRITAEQRNGIWQFAVKDNGIGIEPEHRERIFGIFERLHGQNEFGGGSGIGLAVTKRIIERHGGEIWVESSPGHGAAFHFTLQTNEEEHE